MILSRRIGFTIQQLDRVMEGKLDDVIAALLDADQKAKIAHELQGGTYDDSVQDFLSNYSGLECALSGGDCAKCCECSNPK